MRLKLSLLASACLLSLSACGVYQDYPNDGTAIRTHDGRPATGTYNATNGDVVVGQDKESYMRQNDDKWMYHSCPPGAVRRGDC